jgi:hypothetical protein
MGDNRNFIELYSKRPKSDLFGRGVNTLPCGNQAALAFGFA